MNFYMTANVHRADRRDEIGESHERQKIYAARH